RVGGVSNFPAVSAAAVPAAISNKARRQHRERPLHALRIFSYRNIVRTDSTIMAFFSSLAPVLINGVAASSEARRHRAMIGVALALLRIGRGLSSGLLLAALLEPLIAPAHPAGQSAH